MNTSLIFNSNLLKVKPDWKCDSATFCSRTPAIDEDHIFSATGDGYVGSYRVEDGLPEWREKVGTPVDRPVFTAAHDLALALRDRVVCLDGESGKPIWDAPEKLTEFGLSQLVPSSDGTLVARDRAETIFGLNPDSGEVLWSWKAPSSITTKLIPGDDGVVYLGMSTELVAFDASKGEVKWNEKRRFNISSIAPGDEGRVYLGYGFGKVEELDHQGQPTGWERNLKHSSFSRTQSPQLAYRDGELVAATRGGLVFGFETGKSGREWVRELGNQALSSPVAVGEVGWVVGGLGGKVYGLSKEGIPSWQRDTETGHVTCTDIPGQPRSFVVVDDNRNLEKVTFSLDRVENDETEVSLDIDIEREDGWLLVGGHPIPTDL